MKKNLVLIALTFSLIMQVAFAKEKKESRGVSQDDPNHWGTIEDLTSNQYHFGIYHNGGFAWASITRIQKKSDVSNYVWNDKMVGIFYELQSHDWIKFNEFWSLNFMGRLAVYYPYTYTFRDVEQFTKQTILYAFDFFTAPMFTFNFYNYFRANLEPGIHGLYQLHDQWHYVNLGIGAKADIEFPISSRWTGIIGGMVSWDNGNIGSNRDLRPFDYVWEYQIQLGFRYCKKYLNNTSYIKYTPKPPKTKRKKIKPLTKGLELEAKTEETPSAENKTN